MGFGGISIWQLLIILVIVVLLFGTKRLRNIGSDLGSAIKSFRSSIKENPEETSDDATFQQPHRENPAVQHQTSAQATQAPVQPELKPREQPTTGADKRE